MDASAATGSDVSVAGASPSSRRFCTAASSAVAFTRAGSRYTETSYVARSLRPDPYSETSQAPSAASTRIVANASSHAASSSSAASGKRTTETEAAPASAAFARTSASRRSFASATEVKRSSLMSSAAARFSSAAARFSDASALLASTSAAVGVVGGAPPFAPTAGVAAAEAQTAGAYAPSAQREKRLPVCLAYPSSHLTEHVSPVSMMGHDVACSPFSGSGGETHAPGKRAATASRRSTPQISATSSNDSCDRHPAAATAKTFAPVNAQRFWVPHMTTIPHRGFAAHASSSSAQHSSQNKEVIIAIKASDAPSLSWYSSTSAESAKQYELLYWPWVYVWKTKTQPAFVSHDFSSDTAEHSSMRSFVFV
mmetsp:Transcript_3104/g.12426  ORF Transcript_3104/g.12426 Transcript_3104/m.12426 type:complete len:369 (-) Transcript_3104:2319-3425(-)